MRAAQTLGLLIAEVLRPGVSSTAPAAHDLAPRVTRAGDAAATGNLPAHLSGAIAADARHRPALAEPAGRLAIKAPVDGFAKRAGSHV
jgi:hypothetical protein